MNVARPPGGFKITLSAGVKALVAEFCARSSSYERHWNDIVDRLKFVAHVEGVADSRFKKGCRLWASAAEAERDLPRIKLV